MNRHYCRALIAIPFIIVGAPPLAGLSSTCVAAQAARSTKSSQEGGAETITPLPTSPPRLRANRFYIQHPQPCHLVRHSDRPVAVLRVG